MSFSILGEISRELPGHYSILVLCCCLDEHEWCFKLNFFRVLDRTVLMNTQKFQVRSSK